MQESDIVVRPPPQRPAATASAALLSVTGMVCGHALRAPTSPGMQPADVHFDDKLALGFEFDWIGDKLAVYLVWAGPGARFRVLKLDATGKQVKGQVWPGDLVI
jgi:hypothetical protein